MKKLLLISSIGILITTLNASCNKVWTCNCNGTTNSGQTVSHQPTYEGSKSYAEESCQSFEDSQNVPGVVSTECEIQ